MRFNLFLKKVLSKIKKSALAQLVGIVLFLLSTLAKKYVNAYLEVCPFPKEMVKKSLTAAYLKQLHSVWVEEEHYLKHSTRPDELLPSQYACNEYYFTNREAIEEYLLG